MSDRQTILVASAGVAAVGLGLSAYIWWRKNYKYYQVGTITQLNIFPIKSFKEVSVKEAVCTELGLKHGLMADRYWVVTRSDRKFIPLKDLPKMILIKPSFENDELRLDAPGMDPIKIPVFHNMNNNLKKCVVWYFDMEGLDCGDKVGKWLSTVLEIEGLRLMQYTPDLMTKPFRAFPGLEFYGKKTDKAAYADASPYSLMTTSSQKEVTKQLPLNENIPLINFRPNIVVEGTKPFEEDTWNRVIIGKNHFRAIFKIPRCAVTTIDQTCGVKGLEPLKTLRKIRSTNDKNYKKYFPGSPLYGIYLAPDICGEPIKVGDKVYATYK